MISIGEDEEHIAKHVEQVLLVELVCDILRGTGEVVDNLEGD